MSKIYYAGIDVGSVAAKAVLMSEGKIVSYSVEPTGWSPKEAGRQVFEKALKMAGAGEGEVKSVVGTGYGRVSMDFLQKAVTEITCHALGANYWYPENNLVIDIGGQDSKAILTNQEGKVLNFVMNDKCAAGTGRFFQVIAHALGIEIGDLSGLPQASPVNINSMCTVFAESEVVSLLAAGESKERIVAGLYESVAKRVSSMTGSFGRVSGITFTGGVARIGAMADALSRQLNCPVTVPKNPHLIGALGAALLAERGQ